MFAILLSEKMDPFYQNIGSFPTVIFTAFFVICLFYWLVAVLGLIDIDFLDFDIPDVDGTLDVNADTGLTNANVLAGLMLRFGLVGVPVTIIISIISLIGWVICYYAVYFGSGFFSVGFLRYLVGIPIFLGSLYLAVMSTALIIKPLRPLFKKAQQETIKHVLGQTAIVRTSRVDDHFGEATLEDGGAGLILQVRATSETVFSQGDKVVLLEYLQAENAYRVVSEQEFSQSLTM